MRLEIESFSVTANNVTYAVVGDGFGYWNFFLAADGHGIVPMWGHARVVQSNHPDFSEGERVYGYLPMATHLDVVPGKLSASGFTDMAAHRQPMSPVYNSYSRLAADPEHDPAREGERMIFGPLFKTGFLIEYFMRSQDWFGAEQVSPSASSKTAMDWQALPTPLAPNTPRRADLCRQCRFRGKTGPYDRVLSCDDIGGIEGTDSVSVDFAGNANVLRRLHEHLGSALAYSCLVGATHIEQREGGTGDIPGPTPTLFFAPDHAVALFKQVGPEEAGRQMAESWRGFLVDAGDSVTIERKQGLAAARDVFAHMVAGRVDPAKGIVIEP